MYLTDCHIENVGPLQAVDIKPTITDRGAAPILLVGQNGSGKSILLSIISDAFHELAKKEFIDVVQGGQSIHQPYFRISGSTNQRIRSQHSLSFIRFDQKKENFYYIEKTGNIKKSDLKEDVIARFSPVGGSIPDWPVTVDGVSNFKNVYGQLNDVDKAFLDNVCCYFPWGRNEYPHWLNSVAISREPNFDDFSRFNSNLGDKNIFIYRPLEENRNWILSLILDTRIESGMILEEGKFNLHVIDQDQVIRAYYSAFTLDLLNSIIEDIVGESGARIVARNRQAGERRLCIASENGEEICPSLQHLSAGQISLLNIFCTIIRYADASSMIKSSEEIEGIVIIDEVDAHLHSDMLYFTLPKLIKMFPRVQFIMSAHEPLFILGMDDVFSSDGFSLIELPSGCEITAESYSQFLSSFEYYAKTEKFTAKIESFLSEAEKPVVFFEGSTDVKYVRTALSAIGRNDLLDLVELESVGISEGGGERGGGKDGLRRAFQFLAANPRYVKQPVLLLADADAGWKQEKRGHVTKQSIPQNDSNSIFDGGIENLLPEELCDRRRNESCDSFYQTRSGSGKMNESKGEFFDKSKFCDHICEKYKEKEDVFRNFVSIAQIIERWMAEEEVIFIQNSDG